jgi:hypothetical protein
MKVYKVYKANGDLYTSFDNKTEAEDFLEFGCADVFSEEGFYMEESLICNAVVMIKTYFNATMRTGTEREAGVMNV